jgi:hypothetical protein
VPFASPWLSAPVPELPVMSDFMPFVPLIPLSILPLPLIPVLLPELEDPPVPPLMLPPLAPPDWANTGGAASIAQRVTADNNRELRIGSSVFVKSCE